MTGVSNFQTDELSFPVAWPTTDWISQLVNFEGVTYRDSAPERAISCKMSIAYDEKPRRHHRGRATGSKIKLTEKKAW